MRPINRPGVRQHKTRKHCPLISFTSDLRIRIASCNGTGICQRKACHIQSANLSGNTAVLNLRALPVVSNKTCHFIHISGSGRTANLHIRITAGSIYLAI